MESFFAVTKSLIIRALIIYFVSSFLRRSSTPATNETGADLPNGVGVGVGVPPGQSPARIPASNFFTNGTIFDLHVYVSEDEFNVNFHDPNSLVWFQEGLTYGDWYGGRDGDGTVIHHTKIQASEQLQVRFSTFSFRI